MDKQYEKAGQGIFIHPARTETGWLGEYYTARECISVER